MSSYMRWAILPFTGHPCRPHRRCGYFKACVKSALPRGNTSIHDWILYFGSSGGNNSMTVQLSQWCPWPICRILRTGRSWQESSFSKESTVVSGSFFLSLWPHCQRPECHAPDSSWIKACSSFGQLNFLSCIRNDLLSPLRGHDPTLVHLSWRKLASLFLKMDEDIHKCIHGLAHPVVFKMHVFPFSYKKRKIFFEAPCLCRERRNSFLTWKIHDLYKLVDWKSLHARLFILLKLVFSDLSHLITAITYKKTWAPLTIFDHLWRQ